MDNPFIPPGAILQALGETGLSLYMHFPPYTANRVPLLGSFVLWHGAKHSLQQPSSPQGINATVGLRCPFLR